MNEKLYKIAFQNYATAVDTLFRTSAALEEANETIALLEKKIKELEDNGEQLSSVQNGIHSVSIEHDESGRDNKN